MSSINNAIGMWKEKLLDFSLRNKLLNFKDNGLGYLELLMPDIENIYNQLIENKSLDVFDYDNDNRKGESEKFLTKEEVLKLAKENTSEDKVVIFQKDALISKTMRELDKSAKLIWDEKGINALFLTLGFIYWKDETELDEEYMMPILLAPIKLVFTSVIESSRIQLLENEIILNPTFKVKMLSKHNISIPELQENEPILSYLSKIQAIVEKLRWRITHESIISTFSFMKMQMYEDLSRNTEKISKNRNVLSLLKFNDEIKISKSKNKVDYNIRLNSVVDADSSQMEAVRLAKSGISFVLQGPPGTGKSQTITNIIAELLHDEKKILFVSEKVAALQVVHNNLRKVSLDEFCIELHSNTVNKKVFVDEIISTVQKEKYTFDSKFDEELRILEESQESLVEYAKEIHKINPIIERSLYELYEEVSKLDNIADAKFSIDVSEKGNVHLQESLEILEEFKSYEAAIGYDYKENEWYGYDNPDSSLKHRNSVKDVITNLLKEIDDFIAFKREINKKYKIVVSSFKGLQALGKFISLIPDMNFFHKELCDEIRLSEIIGKFTLLGKRSIEILDLKSNIGHYYNENIYSLDIDSILPRYQDLSAANMKILSKQFNKESKTFKTSLKNSRKVELEVALPILQMVKKVNELEESIRKDMVLAEEVLGDAYFGYATDWPNVNSNIKKLKAIITYLDISSLKDIDMEAFNELQVDIQQYKKQVSLHVKKLSNEFTILLNSFDEEIYDFHSTNLSLMQAKFQKCLESINKLENWNRFVGILKRFKELDFIKFVDYCIDKKIPINDIHKIYSKLLYTNWIENLFAQSPILSNFSRVAHDKQLKQFVTKDKAALGIARAKIRAKLSNIRPTHDALVQNSEITQIMREGAKKRNQMSIYELLSSHTRLIQQVKPCFLMSPLSVSTYLSPDINFDVVIFDEASQIFPQDAIGAIYRANQVIVVGDSKQMPPSDFFNSSDSGEGTQRDDQEDINDFESLLDICSVSYHQTTLKWHYRSKTEDLITFSNKHFYKNELVSFPSAEMKRLGLGVEFHYFDGGVYNRKTRTNPLEAEWIAELVFDHYKDNPNTSLGVVAFSQSQQAAIENAIDKKRKVDNSLEPYLNASHEESFFVKNLETVQGYERDTIVFSMGYAKDEDGKFVMNFGPLNRQGGERRLNVAVTRARYNLQVVSSIRSYDIDASKTESIGVVMVKDYLEFAETSSSLNQKVSEETETRVKLNSSLEREIYNFLIESGYTVETQLGNSEHKIALAVVHPNRKKYMLAIETDGVAYFQNTSIRDRDRLRQSVLEHYGWNYYRIWSTDWLKNKQVEKERLLDHLKSLIQSEEDYSITETI